MRRGMLLPNGGPRGPMPVIIGLMLFLATLAAAAALTLSNAARGLEGGDRLTVQIMAADPRVGEAEALRALEVLGGRAEVASARRAGDAEMQALLEPWLGQAVGEDLPVPILIEAQLRPDSRIEPVRSAVAAAAPSAVVNAQAHWLGPVQRLVTSLRWLAAALLIVVGLATLAMVTLAARASLSAHGETVGLLHLMGATDRQIVRMFERRIALQALIGGLAGWAAALLVLLLVSHHLQALADTPVAGAGMSPRQLWPLLLLPVAAPLLAMLVARATLLRALRGTR